MTVQWDSTCHPGPDWRPQTYSDRGPAASDYLRKNSHPWTSEATAMSWQLWPTTVSDACPNVQQSAGRRTSVALPPAALLGILLVRLSLLLLEPTKDSSLGIGICQASRRWLHSRRLQKNVRVDESGECPVCQVELPTCWLLPAWDCWKPAVKIVLEKSKRCLALCNMCLEESSGKSYVGVGQEHSPLLS